MALFTMLRMVGLLFSSSALSLFQKLHFAMVRFLRFPARNRVRVYDWVNYRQPGLYS